MNSRESTPTTPPRRGRPPSDRAQQAIVVAATRKFAEHGFGGTSLRDIAAAADVDAALIIRHFGSKESLFLQTMSVDSGFRGLVDGPLDTLGRTILRRLVEDLDDTTRAMYAALGRSLDREDVRTYVRESTARHIVAPLANRLLGPDPEVRAWLVGAQVTGLMTATWVLDGTTAPAVALPAPVLDLYARAIQALIDPPR